MSSEELSSIVHRLFAVGYSLTVCLAIMVSVSSGVVTDYWKDTIDGCILYADIYQPDALTQHNGQHRPQPKIPVKNSSWVMTGSDLSVCNYTTFTPVFFHIHRPDVHQLSPEASLLQALLEGRRIGRQIRFLGDDGPSIGRLVRVNDAAGPGRCLHSHARPRLHVQWVAQLRHLARLVALAGHFIDADTRTV